MNIFLIKKSFFDFWDNLLGLIIINTGFLLCLTAIFLFPFFFKSSSMLITILLLLPGLFLTHIYSGIVSSLVQNISDFKSISIKMISIGFLKTWKEALMLAGINNVIITVLAVGLPFYMSLGRVIGAAGAGIMFWISILWLLSCQYFFPVLLRMEGNFFVSLKKSILITLDNPLFSVFILLYSTMLLTLSVITVFILPGASAVLLFHQNAVRLRLYKYDWLEKNIGAQKKNIPWSTLLEDDRDSLGVRSLKGTIFPWKD